MMIVTDKAAEKIQVLLKAEGKDTHCGLRIGVSSGGCSGFQYEMVFDAPKEEDEVFSNGEAKVLVDKKSLLFVDGSVLDYNEGLTNAGFVIRNPHATDTCGCGQSFSV
ncbi:MAG TPA: iron-sulfur cluster assembly accessory protein [Planctomycetes bacterium]|nr:iron-sulfur cluster assembly accessory protein [Planctomycetota bacterium]